MNTASVVDLDGAVFANHELEDCRGFQVGVASGFWVSRLNAAYQARLDDVRVSLETGIGR